MQKTETDTLENTVYINKDGCHILTLENTEIDTTVNFRDVDLEFALVVAESHLLSML